MPTLMKTALEYMNRTTLQEVIQTDLISRVSKRTGSSKESVRGSIIGYSPAKMFSRPSFYNKWDVCRRKDGKPARFVRKGTKPAEVYKVNYNTPSKQNARSHGLQRVTKQTRTYLTLAGTDGFCVKDILKICPTAVIHNVERYLEILDALENHNLPLINHHSTLSRFIHGSTFADTKFHLLNLDLMGYACGKLNQDMKIINDLQNSRFITLTLMGIKRFRNTGKFVKWAKSKFKSQDPTRQWLRYTLSNYTMTDAWFYRRDPDKGCRNMRMFMFKRNT